MRIAMPRTYYPHWGAYSGINQVLKFINHDVYQIHERLFSDNDDDFPIRSPRVRGPLRRLVQARGMEWYKLSDLKAELWLLREWLRKRVDVIHYAEGEHTAQFLPRLAFIPRARRPKIMATYHQPSSLLAKLVDPGVFRCLDHIIVMAPDQAEYLGRLTDPAKISVILHGIDTDFFRPAVGLRPGPTVCCLTVGYWQRDYEAVEAVARLLIDDPDISFEIVTAHDTALSDLPNVTVYRKISDDELLRRYQEADVLLLPLHQATANNALLEALGCGLPIISTALPAVRAYAPGQEALLFERNDPRELADAILRLKANPRQREHMGREARRRALELDWRKIAPQYERVYDQVYGGQGRAIQSTTHAS